MRGEGGGGVEEDLVFQVEGERERERDGFSPQIGGKVGPSAPTHVYIEQIFSLWRATNTNIWLCQGSAFSHIFPIVVQIRPENRVDQQRAIVTVASFR